MAILKISGLQWHKRLALEWHFGISLGCVWRRWLNHLVVVTAGGALGWVWGLFGRQPEGFWSPVGAHMGPARKRLAMKAAPAVSPWLCLACPLILPWKAAASFFSLCLPSPSSKCPTTFPLSRSFQLSGIICLNATWQRPTRFVAG